MTNIFTTGSYTFLITTENLRRYFVLIYENITGREMREEEGFVIEDIETVYDFIEYLNNWFPNQFAFSINTEDDVLLIIY